MNYGTNLSSSDSKMVPKIKKRSVKNCHATFEKITNISCLSLKIDDNDLIKNR